MKLAKNSRNNEIPGESQRILELREKIEDNDYVLGAIMRIAQILSGEIAQGFGEKHDRS